MQDFRQRLNEIKRPIIFVLILLVLFLEVSRQITKASFKDDNMIANRNKNIIKIQKEEKDTIDVLMVGDSESYSSFSPMQMWTDHGITSFVCGQSGQKIQETYYMLKTVFHNQSPKVVVLETNTLFRAQVGLSGLKESVIDKSTYYLPIFRYHDIWKPIFFGKKYAEDSYKGFLLQGAVVPYEGGEYMNMTTDKAEISGMVQEYMEKIISLCKENNASLCLISAPSPVNYNSAKHNALQQYADLNSLPYEDLNLKQQELGIDWKYDTQDRGDHLNLAGAQKVTGFLGNYLAQNYRLKDHRKDCSYQSWSEKAKSYQTKEAEVMALIRKK